MTQKATTRARTQAPTPASWVAPCVRGAVVVTVVLVIVGFYSGANDVYVVPKMALLVAGALVVIGAVCWATADAGGIEIVWSPLLPLLAITLACMGLATVFGDLRLVSLFGEYGRNAGLLTYTAAGVLLVAVLVYFDQRTLPLLASGLAAGSAIVVVFGVLQVLGMEPVGATLGGGVLSTLGQVNFVAGFSGVTVPMFLWVAVDSAHPPPWRWAASAGLLAALVVAVESQSFQAYFAVPAAVLVMWVAWGRDRWGRRVVALVLVGAAGVTVLSGVLLRHEVERQLRTGLDERVLMWQAGGSMVADRPVLGFGPSGYAAQFGAHRPLAHARFGIFALVDAPHDVPLAMFVSGGVLLGLAYLAFVGYVGWLLVAGLRELTGRRRLLLGAFGGAWLGYQVQSLVSIDVPVLIVSHFVCAAAIVVLVRPPLYRIIEVRGLTMRGRSGRRAVTTAGRALQALATVLVLLGLWFLALRPLNADISAARALDARASGDLARAVVEAKRATSSSPWVGRYWVERAAVLAASGDQDGALEAGKMASRLQPSAVSYALSEAQLAARMGRKDIADQYFDVAVRNGPTISDAFRAKAVYLLEQKKTVEAIPLLRKAIELLPKGVGARLLLADAYTDLGRAQEARAEYEAVLRLEPTNSEALRALGGPSS